MLKRLPEIIQAEIDKEKWRVELSEEQKKNNNAVKAEKLKIEMDRLNMMFRKGRIEEEEYDEEYFKLEKQLAGLDLTEELPERNLEVLKGIMETPYKEMYADMSKETRKSFWRGFIREFAITEDKKIDINSFIFF